MSTGATSAVPAAPRHFTVVVIGSGFGGTITALTVARELNRRGRGETLHILERGTWWTTPVGTVRDRDVAAQKYLADHKQPVQFWPSVNHFKGLIDIFNRCVRRPKNEDGLYDVTLFGSRGLLGFGAHSDGVSILRANGVGGGSLVYSNITIRPPDFVLDDPRWPKWDPVERNRDFDLARDAIGLGVLHALDKRHDLPPGQSPAKPVNEGLSNIVTRSARLNPDWDQRWDAWKSRRIKFIKTPKPSGSFDPENRLWIDRARIFQTTIKEFTADFGTVDSAINDLLPEDADPKQSVPVTITNYCERQGRCNVGCLPGARHTLNKQLMQAILGTPNRPQPDLKDISLEALAEVQVIEPRREGGYLIKYLQRDPDDPSRATPAALTADRVIVAAGCVGTNELLLRCKAANALPHLSEKLGYGFSTNGDYIAFLDPTKERVGLTKGPVTTSFAHFNTPEASPGGAVDVAKFHTLEDQGIPPALASTIGFGVPLIRSLARGRRARLFVLIALVRWAVHRFTGLVAAFFQNYRHRQDDFRSEEEFTANMMCVVGMGREASVGQFSLDASGNLRLRRTDGKQFFEDPIYDEIRASLDRLGARMAATPDTRFINPFLSEAVDALEAKSITLTHPLGGCRMAASIADGVVDANGRVFKAHGSEGARFYEGLYLADASMIPTALGVNPSLTISALAFRVARQVIAGL